MLNKIAFLNQQFFNIWAIDFSPRNILKLLSQQKQKRIPKTFNIVSAAESETLKCLDWSEKRIAFKNILATRLVSCNLVSVFHSQTKVNNNYLVIKDAEVIGLDVFVDEACLVNLLNSHKHLLKNVFETHLISYPFICQILFYRIFCIFRLYKRISAKISVPKNSWNVLYTSIYKGFMIEELSSYVLVRLLILVSCNLNGYLIFRGFFFVQIYNSKTASTKFFFKLVQFAFMVQGLIMRLGKDILIFLRFYCRFKHIIEFVLINNWCRTSRLCSDYFFNHISFLIYNY